jgi:hypothetical protein
LRINRCDEVPHELDDKIFSRRTRVTPAGSRPDFERFSNAGLFEMFLII